MNEPTFRPWTRRHALIIACACLLSGLAWWFVPRVSLLSDFFGPALPSPELIWKVRDAKRFPRALSVHGDTVYVAGAYVTSHNRYLGMETAGSFLARYRGEDGELVWTRDLDQAVRPIERPSVHDVATTSDGRVCVLSHHYTSFDNAQVRCFDADGTPSSEHWLKVPRSTELLPTRDGGLVLGGSQVFSETGVMPFTGAWLGELRSGQLQWKASRAGKADSHSQVLALALSPDGDIITGGFLGRGPHVSWPWIAKWGADGALRWSHAMACYTWSNQAVKTLAVTKSGAIWAGGFCDSPWVRRYSPGGQIRAEHRFASHDFPIQLYATDESYVVGSLDGADMHGQLGRGWKIRGVTTTGFPRWTIHREGCSTLTGLQPTASGAIVALGFCSGTMVLAKFAPPP